VSGGGEQRTSVLRAIPGRTWADLAVVSALSLLGVAGFQPAFGQYSFLIAAAGGLLVGTAAAFAGYLLRMSVLTTIALAIAGYFAFGGLFAMPASAIGRVVPSLDTLAGLVSGAVFGWGDALTLRTPLEAPPYIAVVPYVSTWLVALVSVSLVCRWLPRRRRTAARMAVLVAPAAVLFVGAILLGTREPFYAGVRGVLFAGLALAWVGWRRTGGATDGGVAAAPIPGALRRKVLGSGVVILGAVAVAAIAGTALTPPDAGRFVLRQEVTPPFQPLDYPSPLAGFRKYTKDLEKTKLFTVTGAAPGSYVRLATMDTYNGVVWKVASPGAGSTETGSFELLGRSIPTPPLFTAGAKQKVEFRILDYKDVWLPGQGYATSLDFESHKGTDPTTTVRINTATGTAALTSGVGAGLSYVVSVTDQKVPGDKQLAHVPPAKIATADVADVPDIVTSKAKEYAGSANTAIQKLRNIERSLKTFGYLSHGRASDPVPSRAGEGADRMTQLFTQSPMVGDQEQYASAFALMANSLGYPVRVVMGFKPPSGGGTVTVTGNDVTAWDEVAFQGVGWVPFFPTPTKTDAPKEQTVKPKLQPQPQVRQPPRTNPKDDQLLTPVKTKDDHQKPKKPGFEIPGWAWVTAAIVGIPLLAYFVPLFIVWLLKRRRRRRNELGPPDRQAAGAWDELTAGFSEFGMTIPKPATRLQTAEAVERQAREQDLAVPPGSLAVLAGRVDRAVFDAGDADDTTVKSVWTEADAILAGVRGGAGWLRRRIAAFRYRRRP
jgi:hypothetical protein